MPALAVSDVMRAAAAKQIEKHVELFTLGERGAIHWRYVLEATLAILCDAHHEPNPRATPWTQILLLYEFHRRVDGNDESMLLPPELVRRSMDENEFWRGVRVIGHSFGPLTSETASDHDHLIETVHRLFPENSRDFLRIEMNFAEDRNGDLQERLPGLIERAFHSLPNETILRAVLVGLQRHHPDFLDVAVETLRQKFVVTGAGAGQRLAVWRFVLENLNLARRFTASAAVAAEVRALLAADAGAGGTMLRAQLLNELGNCHRYAGEFKQALECYEAALELWSRDANDRDTRVVLRNRAIVLRSLHRYAEAREGFAGLRPLAHDAELLGLVNSEALCLAQMERPTRRWCCSMRTSRYWPTHR